MEVEKEKEKDKNDNEKSKTIENNENENNINIAKEENTLENSKTINYGDLIVVYENGDSVKYFTLEKGKKLNNKYGTFSHDDIYGKNYGCKIYNKDNTKYI